MKNASLYLALAFLFTHELDAMPNHEWRVLPGLSALPDDVAMLVFVVAHVPLFALILALVSSTTARVRSISRRALAGVIAVHAIAHALSVGRAGYEFDSILSSVLIFGGGLCGAVYLLCEAKESSAGRLGQN